MKADYKKETGQDWKPGQTPVVQEEKKEVKMAASGNDKAVEELKVKCESQGDKVRQLKGSGASKVSISGNAYYWGLSSPLY